jgi:hypothetical protein
LQFEADRRAFIITINSFGTELSMDDREKLYPTCGKLHPDGLARLARCEDYDQVKAVADCYPVSDILQLRGGGGDTGIFYVMNYFHRSMLPFLLGLVQIQEKKRWRTNFLRKRYKLACFYDCKTWC